MSIAWSIEELQSHIDEVTTGEKIIPIELSGRDTPHYILVKYPNRKILRLSEIEYDKYIYTAARLGVRTEAEMEKLIREKGIWTEDDDEIVAELMERLNKWKNKIVNPDVTENTKKLGLELIAKTEEDIYQAEKKKDVAMQNTAERRARSAKYDFLVWASSYRPETDERLYDNYLTYCEEVDSELRNKLLGEFIKFYLVGHTTEEIRYIARSNLWRIQYVSAQKANMPLFPNSIRELTPFQLNLIWWSSYYQSIYELLPDDQPEDYIIEDDESLDKYMEDLHKERSKDRATRRAEKKYGANTAMKMQTALVMKSNPDYWDYDYDAANPITKKGQSNITLMDDPKNKAQAFKKTKGIQRSRKYTAPKNEDE